MRNRFLLVTGNQLQNIMDMSRIKYQQKEPTVLYNTVSFWDELKSVYYLELEPLVCQNMLPHLKTMSVSRSGRLCSVHVRGTKDKRKKLKRARAHSLISHAHRNNRNSIMATPLSLTKERSTVYITDPDCPKPPIRP